MKHPFNARVVSIAFVVSLAAGLAPLAAHAATSVSASWVQSAAAGPSAREGVSLAYDTVNHHTVLFGGAPGSTDPYASDTWTYDGSSWTQLPIAGPSPRYLAPMIFDTSRGVSVLFGGYGDAGYLQDTWELSGSTWTQRWTTHSPPQRDWSAMTYDARRHVAVLFGGTGAAGLLLNDTWEYDGNDWTQVTTAHAPSPRRGMGLAFDSLRGKTVLFGGQADVNQRDTWEYDGVDWTQPALSTPPTSPNFRMWQGMAFDAALGGVVMFGGLEAGGLNGDSWVYDGASWAQIQLSPGPSDRYWAPLAYDSDHSALVMFGGTQEIGGIGPVFGDTWSLKGTATSPVDWGQASPATSPSPRVFSQMAYDSARGVSVLFGGSSDSGPGNLNDTWEWNGFSWTQASPATSPPPVAGGAMAYDGGRGVSVLFGGSGSAGALSSTWEWGGTNWTQRTPASSPSARVWAAMAFDSARGRMVLFGGDGPAGARLGDTWEYDGTNWMRLSPANSPSPRLGAAMAFDPTLGRTVLFGGSTDTGRVSDTWEWDGTNWTRISTASAPSPRFWASLAFDAQRGKTVLFGGDHFQPYDLGESNDTWEWDGNQWTRDWTTGAPAIRSGQVMTYDGARSRLVAFGGWNAATSPATIYGDTWELGNGIPPATGTSGGTLTVGGFGTNFGSVLVGTTPNGGAAFGVTSTGTGPLTVNSITLTGSADFAMTNDCPVAGNPLPSGSVCHTVVFFAPTSAGVKTATVAFDYNAPGGVQTFQLQGTGVVIPTSLTVFAAPTAIFGGSATISASLTANGAPFEGQIVTLSLPNGASITTATDSSGVAVWGISLAGIHAGTYPAGIVVSFAGTPAYASSSASAPLTITQQVTVTYTGDYFALDSGSPRLALTIDQRTPASDRQFVDYGSTAVWARFTVAGAGTTTDFYARVNDAADWTTSGLGVASVTPPALPDGAYTVTVVLVDGAGSKSLSNAVAGEEVGVGLVSSPTRSGYLSGGGAIATDPAANTADSHGYFAFQMKPAGAPQGNLVYEYRVRMDVGGGNVRDVDVWVTSTDVTSVTGNSSSATATGHFNVEFVDAQTGQRYSAFEFAGGTYKLSAVNATSKAPAQFALVLERPDDTLFHASGGVNPGGNASLSIVVLGSLVVHL
jgi:hypothetical protein